MALQKSRTSSWVRHYYNNLENNKIQCKICSYITDYTLILKVHLFRAHKIFRDEDMDYRHGPIWRYFKEEERFTSKCKICDSLLLTGYLASQLKKHLKRKHPQIIKEIQEEFEHSWISAHFISNTSDDKLKCKICCYPFNVLQNDVDDLAYHLVKHGLNKKTTKSSGENNVQRDTKSKSWIWQHYNKFQNHKIQCDICHKNYSTPYDVNTLAAHLFYIHQILPDEEINKQNKQKGLIWQYFTKEGRYASKCKICNSSLAYGFNVTKLKRHMKQKHPLILEKIRNKFKHSWVSENFVSNTSNEKLQCKICRKKFDLFKDKIDDLANHLSKHGINKKTKENTDRNDMTMDYQSEENNE